MTIEEPIIESTFANSQESSISPNRFTKGRIAVAAAAGILLAIGGGILAYALFSGGGAQPESVLPRDTTVFAKIDLNPKIGQRVNLVRLVAKFPKALKNFNQDDPIGSVFNEVTQNSSYDWAQLKPWIGNRFALGGIQTSNGMQMVVVVSITNESEMRYFMAKQFPNLKFFVASNYAVIGDSQETINLVKSAPSHLSDNATFNSDISALGGDQLGLAWGEVKNLDSLLGGSLDSYLSNSGVGGNLGSLRNTTGRVVLGFHATSDSLVATFLTRGFSASSIDWPTGEISATDLQNLPATTLAAISLEGAGKALSQFVADNAYAANVMSDMFGVQGRDIEALLDGPIELIVMKNNSSEGTPLVVLRLTPKKDSNSSNVVERALAYSKSSNSFYYPFIQDGSFLYLGADKESIRSVIRDIKSTGSKLGDSDLFKKTVTESGVLVGYANLEQLLASFSISGNYKPLAALGLIVSVDKKEPGSSHSTITVTLK